ncbi:hypothetical protein [Neobacillus sp. CF12]|uniref:hypothetical protein n=1 Tax=Neobacillus sp. CF12 TaxID=3055864 RepID=UPI0025A083AB|nr:hypothetical protein [Neobacillus sp. CF12]MDM5330093.1 hypothetical protein [Neobacillus sp. CF12]
MGKEFSNHNSVRMSFITAAIIGIIGIGLLTIHVFLGTLVLMLAVVAFGMFHYFGTDTTVICHEKGFTVKLVNKVKGPHSMNTGGKRLPKPNTMITKVEKII